MITEDDYQDLKAEALNLMKQSRMKPVLSLKALLWKIHCRVIPSIDDVTVSDTLDGTTIEQDVVLTADTLEGES